MHAPVQNIWLRSYSPTLGKQGVIHGIDAFCPFDGGRAHSSRKCLFIEQLAFFGNRRNPWHGRNVQPGGNERRWGTIGNGWSEWLLRIAQPGWNDWKRWIHPAGNRWSEWHWRA